MRAVVKSIRGKAVYFLDGRRVTKKHFEQACPDLGVPLERGARAKRGWPIVSDALAVHSKSVREAEASAAKRGVPTEFRKDGRPVFRDRSHRRAYLRAYGYIDRNSYTGY